MVTPSTTGRAVVRREGVTRSNDDGGTTVPSTEVPRSTSCNRTWGMQA